MDCLRGLVDLAQFIVENPAGWFPKKDVIGFVAKSNNGHDIKKSALPFFDPGE